jgi:hypothetical protein|tara:strand:- start:26 stop:427 length:402 start_codon:yes stop_codon:yes gene_type:complete
MLSTWQLSWNEKSYKATERMLAAAASEEGKHMVQSWGNSSVKNINKIKSGDTVYISCNKKCIGKAIIVQPFKQTAEITTDKFAIIQPNRQKRLGNKWSCHLRITEIYFEDYQKELRGNQNTFCNPKKAFWKNT